VARSEGLRRLRQSGIDKRWSSATPIEQVHASRNS
jgi:hypothetical protein